MRLFTLFVRWNAVSAFLLVFALVAAYGGDRGGLRFESTFERGELYRTQGGLYRVAVMSGTWREMGRQYGGLLGE